MSDQPHRRVAWGVLANGMGRAWVILIQLASVPILSVHWGVSGYGRWLMLLAIPTYLALSDFGFGAVGAAEMTRATALGRITDALTAFQSIWTFVTGISTIIVLTGCLGITIIILISKYELNTLNILYSAGILSIYSFLSLQANLIAIGYRSTNRYALGTLLQEALIPIEGLAVIILALTGHGIVAAATAITCIRFLGVSLFFFIIHRLEPWFRIGTSHANLTCIRRMSRPAIASVGFSVSQAIGLQGVILTLGFFSSPATAALFGACRTLARVPVQISALLTRACAPELTRAAASGNRRLSTRISSANLLISGGLSILFSMLFFLFGKDALIHLSHGKMVAPSYLFLILAAGLISQTIWNTIAQFLFAINRQDSFAHFYMTIAAITASAPIISPGHFVLGATAAVSATCDTAMLIFIYSAWKVITKTSIPDITSNVIDMMKSALSLSKRKLYGRVP